ncbi:hypothetical protein NXW90_22525 [Bacteroides fragilis]|nr:hypothetical protein [Bacteroides fragilis]
MATNVTGTIEKLANEGAPQSRSESLRMYFTGGLAYRQPFSDIGTQIGIQIVTLAVLSGNHIVSIQAYPNPIK